MQHPKKRSQHARTMMMSTNAIGSPLTVPYLMCTLTFLSLLTASTFIFSYMVYKRPTEKAGSRGLLSSLVARAGGDSTQHICNETYCKAAARYYSRHVTLPLDMCEQLASSVCNTTKTIHGNNSSSFHHTASQRTRMYFETLNINAMVAERYFPVVQLQEFLEVCVRSTKKNGVNDFIMLMENFGLKQWPVAPERVDLTSLIASVARELGQQPLFSLSVVGNANPGAPDVTLHLDRPQLLLKKAIPTSAAPVLFIMTKYLEEYCGRFGICLKHGEAEHVVSTIVKFEELLYSYMHPFSKPIKMKLKNMNSNKINWHKLVTGILGDSANLSSESEVTIQSPQYFNGLDQVLEKTSESAVILYVGYTIFSSFAPLIIGLEASSNILPLMDAEQTRHWAQFQCVLLSESVFAFAYLHTFSTLPLFDVHQRAVVRAAKDTIEMLKEFTTKAPWFKKEDADIVHEKLSRLEISALVPDIAKIRRFVQEYYNNIPVYNKDISFLQNFYIMKKFATSKAWSTSKSPESRHYRWPVLSFRKKCFHDMQENRLYIPAIHMLMVQNATEKIEFPQIPTIAYYILHALMPLFFRAGSLYDQYGNYKEWWTVETEESFSRAESCLVEQYLNSMHGSGNVLQGESKGLASHILSQNFLIEPAYKLYSSHLDSAGYDRSNFSLHESFPADSKEVFYIAHMLTICKEIDAARSTVLYSDSPSQLYRYSIPFYNFELYRELATACNIKHLSILSQIKFCKIWD